MQSKPHERIIEIADARLIPMMEKIKELVEEEMKQALLLTVNN